MEWALSIPRGQALKWLEEPWGVKETGPGSLADVREVCEGKFGQVKFTRMYFGQEFCEKALPIHKELDQALALAEQLGMNFTLVTPYVTEPGLKAVKGLFQQLIRVQPRAEVVVNDWGVLQTIAEDYPTLTPVLGRLLNKLLRDPRMLTHFKKPEGEALTRFRTCSLAGSPMKDLLNHYQVGRIELDFPPQGLDDDLAKWGYESTLYLPYGVIMTGRICLLHSWGLEEHQKFKPFSGGCDRKCRFYWLEMSDPGIQVRKSKNWVILQKGNTIFYQQQKKFLKVGLDTATRVGITRVVIQREPI
jgi:Collagenase and related proteases